MRSVEVLVIGGGAAGMAAAIEAARAGKRVLLLEKKKELGKKLFATGNGRCNFTNRLQSESCYHGEHPSLAFAAVKRFDDAEVIAWFRELGVLSASKQGYVYPASFQAASVVHALTRELRFLEVECHVEEAVREVSANGQGYLVRTERDRYLARTLLISAGGKAAPVHGSDGDGFRFAEELGHTIIPPLPALTSLVLEGRFMKHWAGNRLQGKVWLETEEGEELAMEQGEIQLVDYGISGIPVFQVSRFAAKALAERRKVFLYLDSMPELSEKEVKEELVRRKERSGRFRTGCTAAEMLEGMLPDRFARTILEVSKLSFQTSVSGWKRDELIRLAGQMKHLKLPVKEVSHFEKAQVCAGGVSLLEMELSTFASKKREHLYLAGEVLDVDGTCGGYNLQWAWTSGITAGRAIGAEKNTLGNHKELP